MPTGTPFPFQEDIFSEILSIISTTTEGIQCILKEKETYPSKTTWDKWLNEDKAIASRYARAKEEQADILADEILQIADENNADVVGVDDYGKPIIDGNAIQRSRLKIDARKWLASKLKPKKYGDKVDITSDGEQLKDNNAALMAIAASINSKSNDPS